MNKATITNIATFAVGLGVGYAVGYILTKKKWQKIANEDIESVREQYRLTRQPGDREAADKVYEELNSKPSDVDVQIVHEKIKQLAYVIPETIESSDDDQVEASLSKDLAEQMDEDDEEETSDFTIEGQAPEEFFRQHNIFDATIDIDAEALAERDGDKPYVITYEEFQTDEENYDKITLTYYEEDDVLTSADDDSIIPDHEWTVGQHNLHRFGMGSGSRNSVYVRNDQREADFEVVLNKSSYAEVVQGVKFKEPKSRPGKMRSDE